MARRSALTSPPKAQVVAVASVYGAVSSTRPGSPATAARARAWALVDDDRAGRLVVYRYGAAGHRSALERHELGPIHRMTIVGPGRQLEAEGFPAVASGRVGSVRWAVELSSGEVVTATAAPCTCGAGALGYAGPVEGPHSVTYARVDLPWLLA